MSKADRIGRLRVEGMEGLDPHFAGWFACFNRGEFYEAHDVLEALWLRERHAADGRFYKALIQLAGAFVHLQKGRLRPADALFRLAEENLTVYPKSHLGLDVSRVLGVIQEWRGALAEHEFTLNPLGRLPLAPLRPDEVKSSEGVG